MYVTIDGLRIGIWIATRDYARFEGFTAVTMKNTVFWAIKTSSHLTGNTSALQNPAG
jgi:hypothetical protein